MSESHEADTHPRRRQHDGVVVQVGGRRRRPARELLLDVVDGALHGGDLTLQTLLRTVD